MRNIASCAGGCNASVRNSPGLGIITFKGLVCGLSVSFVIMVGKETADLFYVRSFRTHVFVSVSSVPSVVSALSHDSELHLI
jgi:hypothetical protein